MIVIGIDVGGARKGYHAVPLRNGEYVGKYASRRAHRIAAWCRRLGAGVIGVDAPCKWSVTGKARPAESALMKEGIWCFSTPTYEIAKVRPRNHYVWMLAGAELYEYLALTHRLYDGESRDARAPLVVETFPQAVACSLAREIVSAKKKAEVRRRLLRDEGVATENLRNIDLVDAALCALTAHFVANGEFVVYGDAMSGYIVVPSAA